METVSIQIEVRPHTDDSAEFLSRSTIELRKQFLALPIESADLLRDSEAPPGSKAIDALTLGHLVVVTLPFSGVVSAIAAIAIAKIKAGAAREIRISVGKHELHLTGQSETSQAEIIDKWLDGISESGGK